MLTDGKRFIVWVPFVDLLGSKQAAQLEPVAYRTPLGTLNFLWLGPVGLIGAATPYTDWYLSTFYVHRVNWVQ